MSFLSRLLGYATGEECAGARLEQGERWVIAPARDPGVTLRSLSILFADDAFAYFEGTTDGHLAEWLATHSVASPLKVALGTIWPKPDFYHVPLRPDLLEEAAGIVDRRRISLPSTHLHVHDGRRVLLEWHDAFGTDPMYVAPSVSGDRVGEFARASGAAEVARANVWGALMETGYDGAVASLVSFADGTTSMYFTSGGGIIGAGQHETVRAVAEAWLS